MDQGSLDRALEFYSETARVERLALGPLSRDLSITYCKYKNTSRKIGLLPASHASNSLSSTVNIGQIYFQKGELEVAMSKFQMSLEIETLTLPLPILLFENRFVRY